MAKLTKIAQNIFGSGAGTDQISQFGSLFAGSEVFTTNPATAQSLSNWLTGWFAAVIGGNAPTIQDMNAVHFVMTYQLAYLMQAGIAEWDAATTYYIGSLVNVDGAIYVSRTDTNINNLTSDAAYWKKIGGDIMDALGDFIYGGVNGAQTKLAGNTTTTMQVVTQTGTGTGSAAPVLRDFKAPTIQKFLTGSGTYTRPDGVMYLRVRMAGGGGGGGGTGTSGAASGITGDSSTFGTILTCNGGGGAAPASNGGTGGTAAISSPAYGNAIQGGDGCPGSGGPGLASFVGAGGAGGGNSLGGAGAGGWVNGAGQAAKANTGGGGGGGGGNGAGATTYTSGGGGAGGYLDAIIPAPSATYAYKVAVVDADSNHYGKGGAAGTSGFVGGNAAAGYIEVTEYYQ